MQANEANVELGKGQEPRRLGRLVLTERIASGGMAAVYRAHTILPTDALAHVDLAVKVLHDHLAEDPEFIRMFRDEGRIASRLQHANIVRVHEVGEADGRHFLVMDRIDGRNLAKVLEALAAARKQMPRAAAIAVLRATLTALDYVHRLAGKGGRPLGLVHRDISPHNILIASDERVLLTDFGIARGGHRSDRTRTGTIKGKLHYMSPEQARGGAVDARSDLYALGVVAYEMLTSRALLGSEATLQLQARVASGRIELDQAAMARLPEDLRAFLERALAADPAARFADARAMLAALDATRLATASRLKPGTLSSLLALAPPGAGAAKPQLLFHPEELSRPRVSEPDVPLPPGMILTPQRPISGVFVGVPQAPATAGGPALTAPAAPSPRPANLADRVAANPVRSAEAAERKARRPRPQRDDDVAAVRRSQVVALRTAGVDDDDPDVRARPATGAVPAAAATVRASVAALPVRERLEAERRVAIGGIFAWGCVAMLLFATLLEVWNARLELPSVDETSFVALRDQVFGRDAVAVAAPAAAESEPEVVLAPRPAPIRNDRFLPRGVDPPVKNVPPLPPRR